MTLGLAAEMYQRELDRREHLIGAAGLPAGILVVLGGLLGAVATGFSYEVRNLTIPFAAVLGIATSLFVVALVFLIRSYVGHSNAFVPTPKELQVYYDGLLAHYANQPNPSALATAEFDNLLLRKYLEAADKNTNTNDRKSETLHWANRLLAWTLVPALVCATLYAIDQKVVQRIDKIELTPCQAMTRPVR